MHIKEHQTLNLVFVVVVNIYIQSLSRHSYPERLTVSTETFPEANWVKCVIQHGPESNWQPFDSLTAQPSDPLIVCVFQSMDMHSVKDVPWTGCAVLFLQSLCPSVNLLSLYKDPHGKFSVFKVIKLTLTGKPPISEPKGVLTWRSVYLCCSSRLVCVVVLFMLYCFCGLIGLPVLSCDQTQWGVWWGTRS